MAAVAALAMVNIEVGLYYWLPCDTPHVVIPIKNYNMCRWDLPINFPIFF